MSIYNIFDDIKFSDKKEIEETIYEDDKIKLVRILSLDQLTDYYDQDELEIVKIEEGVAELEIDGKIIGLKKGDILPIHPHQVHRVIKQDRVIWFCIFIKK